MLTLREMTQLLPASVLPLAMLFITLDLAESAGPSTKAPSPIQELPARTAARTALHQRTSPILEADVSGNKIVRLADEGNTE